MPRNEHETKRVGSMDENSDVALDIQKSCVLMIGMSSRYPGILEPLCGDQNLAGVLQNALGMFYYYGQNEAQDFLLVCTYTAIYKLVITCVPDTVGGISVGSTAGTASPISNFSGISFAAKKRVRMSQMGNEVIIVQDGGIAPMRYNGTNVYKLGIVAPVAPTAGATPGGALTGAYKYWVTYADELGRESNPSPALSVTLAGTSQVVNWTASADGQVTRVYLYRTAATGTIGYRVVDAGFAIGTTTYTDNISDTTIQTLTQSPRNFQNCVPDPSSVVHVWNNRLVLNSTNDVRSIQISNLQTPSQFSLENDARFPSDGQTRKVYNTQGDEVTMVYHIGSTLGVFARKSMVIVVGDSPSNFQHRAPQRIGCNSPDTVAEINGETWFCSDDGIYAASFEGGFNVRCMSNQISRQFQSTGVYFPWEYQIGITPVLFSQIDRQKTAQAVQINGRYHLSQPPYDCIYDPRTGQWAMYEMVGMTEATGFLSYGYACMCVGSVGSGRAFDVAFISPGDLYTAQTPSVVGGIWSRSMFPYSLNNAPMHFHYVTRAIDGAGIPRGSKKDITRITVFGERAPIAINGTNLVVSIWYDQDPNSHFQDVSPQRQDYIITMTQAEAAMFASEGVICRVDTVGAPSGRVLCVGVKGVWGQGGSIEIYDIRDILVEYVRQDPS